jgi:hypothetical protein
VFLTFFFFLLLYFLKVAIFFWEKKNFTLKTHNFSKFISQIKFQKITKFCHQRKSLHQTSGAYMFQIRIGEFVEVPSRFWAVGSPALQDSGKYSSRANLTPAKEIP